MDSNEGVFIDFSTNFKSMFHFYTTFQETCQNLLFYDVLTLYAPILQNG